ncbi:MAG: hypothetical protein WCL56_00955 [Sediminibacterium sp.]|jgi:hypothetical protein
MNQFDNFFRDQLKDHSAQVPAGLWEKIMPKDEKRRTGFYLPKRLGLGIFIASLIVAGLYGGLKYEQSTNNNLVKISASIDNNSTTVSQNLKTTNDNGISTENTTAISAERNQPINTTHSTAIAVAIATQKQAFAARNKIENTASDNNKKSDYGYSFNAKNKSKNLTGNAIDDQQRTSSINFLKSTNASQKESSILPLNESVNGNFSAFTKINPSLPILLNTTESNTSNALVNKTLLYNEHDKKIQGIIICPNIKGRSSFNSDWGIELYASPDYALKYVSNISAPQQYLDKKDSSEQMQISYTAGFRLIKPLNDNILLKAGFQYSQLNQKFSYRNENEIKTTTVITARTIIRSAGDTILVSDTSVLRQIGYSVNTVHNQFRSIDIPVTLGYQFGNDDLKFGINAGVVFNLSSWYQGEILDTTYASVPMNKVSNALYKTNIGMGLYSSISLIKRINDNTHLFFEPYFRYNLSNMTNNVSPYNQRFHIGGLSVGLRFDLNR